MSARWLILWLSLCLAMLPVHAAVGAVPAGGGAALHCAAPDQGGDSLPDGGSDLASAKHCHKCGGCQLALAVLPAAAGQSTAPTIHSDPPPPFGNHLPEPTRPPPRSL